MKRKNTDILVGLLMGLIVGGMVGGLVCGFIISRRMEKARRGWNLVPVVVATQEIPEGEKVTFEMISLRSVPEQFVTSSAVEPDAVIRIIDHRLNVPVQQGDMLLWSQFEAKKDAAPSTP